MVVNLYILVAKKTDLVNANFGDGIFVGKSLLSTLD